MTPEQIELVQSSFKKVLPIKDTAGELFYDRLFTLDPALRPMFPADLKPQIQKLMAMIATAVGGLTKLEAIVPAVQDLGRRHVGYGVTDAHYDTVGTALLWTLEQGLGADFTPKTKEAWTVCYGLLSATMEDAARTRAAE
jgi:hemoglobin-like flavoprotein